MPVALDSRGYYLEASMHRSDQPFSQTNYRIIQSKDGTRPCDDAFPSQATPFLQKLVMDIANAYHDGDFVYCCKYQSDIARNGYFEIVSPFDGGLIKSGDSICIEDINRLCLFYRFPSCPDLIIGAANMSFGFPLSAVILRSERMIIQIIRTSLWDIQEKDVIKLEEVLSDPKWRQHTTLRELEIFTGDRNFAHHAWNQLGPLERVLSNKGAWAESISIVARHQPLGPLESLFPDLIPHGAVKTHEWPAKRNMPGRVAISPGGSLVTKSIRQKVLSFAKKRLSIERVNEIKRISELNTPKLWISLRTRNRTAENQVEVITLLCKEASRMFPNCAIILDGHSLPDDHRGEKDAPFYRDLVESSIAGDHAAADSIMEKLRESGVPREGQTIIKAIGISLLESVLLAQEADFYFCHHGTTQHKIGWLAAKPGVVHSNPRTLKNNPGPWVARQCEERPPVVYLPPEFVSDPLHEAGAVEMGPYARLENYRFVNPDRTVEFFFDRLRELAPVV